MQREKKDYSKRDKSQSQNNDVYLPGAASLYEQLEKRILLVLTGRKMIMGTLKSYDQFGNLILSDSVERIIVDDEYGDVELGIQFIKGTTVSLLGEIDEKKFLKMNLKKLPTYEILEKSQQREFEKENENIEKKMRDLQLGLVHDDD